MSAWESNGLSDEWYTPKYIFDALDVKFDVDVASPTDKRMCVVPTSNFIYNNSLRCIWNGFAWMNPPFGGRNGIIPWLEKMATHGNGIALTPDRTSAPWWQKAMKQADAIMFIAGKVKFIKPDGTSGNSPSTGTCLFAYGKQAIEALKKAEKNGLGVVLNRI